MVKSAVYQPRSYREGSRGIDLVSFRVVVKETDLFIRAKRLLNKEAMSVVLRHRAELEGYIATHEDFLKSLEPVDVEDAPTIVWSMAEAGRKASVGPMAAVAGAIAELVGYELLKLSDEVVVENGGDIFMHTMQERRVGIYAGESPLTGRIALHIKPEVCPTGICTSSGTLGHSLSFGKADAAVVLSKSAALADAAATAVGNAVKVAEDIEGGIEVARNIEGVSGALIIKGSAIGAWGCVSLA
jgi:hypothetical protein